MVLLRPAKGVSSLPPIPWCNGQSKDAVADRRRPVLSAAPLATAAKGNRTGGAAARKGRDAGRSIAGKRRPTATANGQGGGDEPPSDRTPGPAAAAGGRKAGGDHRTVGSALDGQWLLERAVGLDLADEAARILRADGRLEVAGEAAGRGCNCLQMAAAKRTSAGRAMFGALCKHPSARKPALAAVVQQILSTDGVPVGHCYAVLASCFRKFPEIAAELTPVQVSALFHTRSVSKAASLFTPLPVEPDAYSLAFLLLSRGAPLPLSAFFTAPRRLSSGALADARRHVHCVRASSSDPFPNVVNHDTRLQLLYADVREYAASRLVALLRHIRGVAGGGPRGLVFSCCDDTISVVASFVAFAHPSLYPGATTKRHPLRRLPQTCKTMT
ncbi:hypothetical protein DIPPA_18103 [Diplonema papillatum]|nr:hypothetical protein DIPPA_18103 [Diplonema papillatum]